jgi:hypothetical protein
VIATEMASNYARRLSVNRRIKPSRPTPFKATVKRLKPDAVRMTGHDTATSESESCPRTARRRNALGCKRALRFADVSTPVCLVGCGRPQCTSVRGPSATTAACVDQRSGDRSVVGPETLHISSPWQLIDCHRRPLPAWYNQPPQHITNGDCRYSSLGRLRRMPAV